MFLAVFHCTLLLTCTNTILLLPSLEPGTLLVTLMLSSECSL